MQRRKKERKRKTPSSERAGAQKEFDRANIVKDLR
jgi:hypothetical protein